MRFSAFASYERYDTAERVKRMQQNRKRQGKIFMVTGHMGSGKTTQLHLLLNRNVIAADVDYGQDRHLEEWFSERRNKAMRMTAKEALPIWEEYNAVYVPVARTRMAVMAGMLKDFVYFCHGPTFLQEFAPYGRADAILARVAGVISLELPFDTMSDRLAGRQDTSEWTHEFLASHYEWYRKSLGLWKDLGIPVVSIYDDEPYALPATARSEDVHWTIVQALRDLSGYADPGGRVPVRLRADSKTTTMLKKLVRLG
jgi:energy-coupling factor transporter ATP-binding protein EcfA2